MSVLSGARSVYPRGYIFGMVRADRPDKGIISVTMAQECLHRMSPRATPQGLMVWLSCVQTAKQFARPTSTAGKVKMCKVKVLLLYQKRSSQILPAVI
ncbi:hypothetical protein C5S53_02565 [Methanophagales archaeon]|nr:hypothetical protein C5S53_02565 [Methanophagales archaeon]